MTLQQLRYVITAADSQSLNKAARKLFISQPSLSGAIHELEAETGVELFRRSSKGISLTPEGEEFLGYARQITDQYQLLEERFIAQKNVKKRFSVSMQHYTFAVRAFIELVQRFGMEEYDFAVYETKTAEVIENVKSFKSELGVLYESGFNQKVLEKLLREKELEFHELFSCGVYVYMWKDHPLADSKCIRMEELEPYPCLAFDQGANISFYLAEEMFSTHDYKKIIRACDRATLLNLMVGLDAYTLCCGIICEELNGGGYVAVPLDTEEKMRIGYIARRGMSISPLGEQYLEEMRKYREYLL